jgi:hypothetical protein
MPFYSYFILFLLIFWHNYAYGFVTTQKIQPILVSTTPTPISPSSSKPTILPICGSSVPSETINGYRKSQSNSPYLRLKYQPSYWRFTARRRKGTANFNRKWNISNFISPLYNSTRYNSHN